MALYRNGYSYDMINLEIQLIKFYHYIIIGELKWINLESNRSFLAKVKASYSKYVLQNGLSDVSFDNAGMRSAYIFSNTPCFSSSVAYHFLNFLHANSWMLKKAISQNSLTICCLGGGPGAEVVAIVKALELTLKLFCSIARPLTIYATIIDIDPGWAEISNKVTQNWWKCIDTSVIKLKLSFKQADLTQPLSEVDKEIVKSSDLVTMIKFVSAVYGTKSRDKISEMLQEVIHHMSEDAVLFFLNCSRFSCIQNLNEVITTSDYMTPTFGPFYNVEYRLSGPSLRFCYELYSQHYDNPPAEQCQNHVIAWCKVASLDESEICD